MILSEFEQVKKSGQFAQLLKNKNMTEQDFAKLVSSCRSYEDRNKILETYINWAKKIYVSQPSEIINEAPVKPLQSTGTSSFRDSFKEPFRQQLQLCKEINPGLYNSYCESHNLSENASVEDLLEAFAVHHFDSKLTEQIKNFQSQFVVFPDLTHQNAAQDELKAIQEKKESDRKETEKRYYESLKKEVNSVLDSITKEE